ncbi:hypothetical protein ACIBU0_08790 [Streptomyces sp. NPDC049627]|uniref:hypothetical protein n=1 Tax=Streptomyces sp. NPDC049627 TaxID=3365595 RepID=UPI0037B4379B
MLPSMDQGIAAVLGASVGVIGAIGGSVLTYIGVRHQARTAAALEYQKSVWAERVDLYAEFIEKVEDAHHQLIDIRSHVASFLAKLRDLNFQVNPEIEEEAQEILSAVREAQIPLRDVFKLASRVRILGPQSLNDTAGAVAEVLNSRFRTLARELSAITSGDEATAIQLHEQESSHTSRFVRAFGGFSARAAHVIEGNDPPYVPWNDDDTGHQTPGEGRRDT